jgi:outer membrane protein
MKKNKILLTILIILNFSISLRAESLVDIIKIAFSNSNTYKAAVEQYNITYAYKDIGVTYLYPSLDASISGYYDNVKRNYKDSSIPSSNSKFDNYEADLTLSQTIYDSQAWSMYKKGKLMAEQARIQLDKDKNDIIIQSVIYYFNILNSQNNLDAINYKKDVLEKQLQTVQKKLEVGTAKRTDLETIKSQYMAASAQEIDAKNDLQFQINQLNYYVNQPISNYKKIKESFEGINFDSITLDSLQNNAKIKNLDILLNKINLRLAEEDINANDNTWYPTVGLVGKYSRTNGEDPAKNYNRYKEEEYYAGISAKLNLYSGGQTSEKKKQLSSTKNKTKYLLQELELNIGNQVMQYYLSVDSGLLKIDSLLQAYKSSDIALTSTIKSYELGLVNVNDLLQASQNRFDAKRDLDKSKYDYLLNILQLKSISGTLGLDDIVKVDSYLE